MDSSPSALTDLQRAVLVALPDVAGFYLTGGAALAAFYLGHRRSDDLDLFTDDKDVLELLAQSLEAMAIEQGWNIEALRSAPGFRRYVIRSDAEETLVDIVHEPVHQEVPTPQKPRWQTLRYDALQDVVANKLCALLGRGDVKDLVDLYFIAQSGTDVLNHMKAARRKDGGMDAATLAWVLQGMSVDPSRLLLIRSVSATQLGAFRDEFVRRLLEMAWPEDRSP